jgi:hypothetical protein
MFLAEAMGSLSKLKTKQKQTQNLGFDICCSRPRRVGHCADQNTHSTTGLKTSTHLDKTSCSKVPIG